VRAGLARGWEESMRHEATALADLVRAKKLAPHELTRQAAAAVDRVDGRLAGVLGLFPDAIENPATDGPDTAGRLHGVPIFLKDLGSGLKGRTQESGSRMH